MTEFLPDDDLTSYTKLLEMAHINWNPARVAELQELIASGKSYSEIASQMGITVGHLEKVIGKYKLHGKKAGFELTDDQIAEIKRLYDAGRTIMDISNVMGLSRSGVNYALEKFYSTRQKNKSGGWTPHKINQLKKLYDGGKSIGEISSIMGTTFGIIEKGLDRFIPGWKVKRGGLQEDSALELYIELLEMARGKLWTSAEITQLKALKDQGLTPQQIADRMGISKGRVKGGLDKYYSDRAKRKAWTPEEITQLKALRDQGLSYEEIAQRMGISTDRVDGGLDKYYSDRAKLKQKEWTSEEITQLKALKDQGLTPRQIAQQMGRTEQSINVALYKYYSDRAKLKQKEWTPEEITQLKALKDQGLTPQQIADRMGISKDRVNRGLHKYYPARKKDISRRPKGITMDKAKDMVEMYRNGLSLTHLSKVYSITVGNIIQWIKKYCRINSINLQQLQAEHKANKDIIHRQAGKQYGPIDEDLSEYLRLLQG
jgi:hypothetical protein